MHEYSIVQSLIDLAQDNAIQNNAKEVVRLEVKIGVLSGVEIQLLRSAFETFKEGTICEKAEFITKIQQVIVKCRTCKEESELQKDEYICPKCLSGDLEILDGDDMYLMSLELVK